MSQTNAGLANEATLNVNDDGSNGEVPKRRPTKKESKKAKKQKASKTQKLIVGGMFGSLFLTLFFAVNLGLLNMGPKYEADESFVAPHSIYDASHECQRKMKDKFGSTLLRSYMDERSSRVDGGIYRVFFKADVGTPSAFNEVTIYCYVERSGLALDYLREINPVAEEQSTKNVEFF